MTRLPPGKLPAPVLRALLEGRTPAEGEVVGPGIGRDGAVLRLSGSAGDGRPGDAASRDGTPGDGEDLFLVAAADPITFTADRIGWYAVHVNANDVACMGANPAWFLATVLLPEGATDEEAAGIVADIRAACAEVGAGLVGGHTEVTPGLDRPLVAGTMLGTTRRWVSAEGARAGDALLLTTGIAVEGTAILAADAADRLAGKVDEAVLERARGFLRDPGLSVVSAARTALAAGTVHALHDPTEGGLSAGIHELCEAAGTGAVIELEAVPVLEETRRIAAALELDPMGLLASGALLVAAPESAAAPILAALDAEGIRAARIGRLTHPSEGVLATDLAGRTAPFPTTDGDELARVL